MLTDVYWIQELLFAVLMMTLTLSPPPPPQGGRGYFRLTGFEEQYFQFLSDAPKAQQLWFHACREQKAFTPLRLS